MGDGMESPGEGERGSDCMKRIWGRQGRSPPLTKVCFRWSLGTGLGWGGFKPQSPREHSLGQGGEDIEVTGLRG